MAVTSPFFFLHWGRKGQKALPHVATLGSAGGGGQNGGRGDGGDGGDGCVSGGPLNSTVEAVVTVPGRPRPCRASGGSGRWGEGGVDGGALGSGGGKGGGSDDGGSDCGGGGGKRRASRRRRRPRPSASSVPATCWKVGVGEGWLLNVTLGPRAR